MRIKKCLLAEARIEDAIFLQPRLSQEDKLEAELALGKEKADRALLYSMAKSHICRSVFVEGQIVGMMGIAALGHDGLNNGTMHGSIWCMSAEKMRQYPLAYMFYGKMLVLEGLSIYEKLINYVYIENDKTIRWLKMLGAEFSEPISYGVHEDKQLFRRFEICAYQHQ